MVSSDSYESDDFEEEIRDFEVEGQMITNNLLPAKSMLRYNQIYDEFIKWTKLNKVELKAINENLLLVYFNELLEKLKPSTVWGQWSMLKTTLNLRHGIKINDFEKLKSLLKNKSKGYKPKKAQVLTWEQIQQFLNSDDHIYLSHKVMLIFGIFGALRSQELHNISINDIEDTGTQYIVQVKDTKNYYPRSFIITDKFYDIVKKYINLRPDKMEHSKFFINFQKGSCTRQVIGKNKISGGPKTIAAYLNLENAESYSGHSYRRTAATLLSNGGGDLILLKQLGGWKSDAVAQGYVQNSILSKKKIFDKITSGGDSFTSKSISDEAKEKYQTSVLVNSLNLVDRSHPLLINQDVSTSRSNLVQSVPKKHKLSDQQTDLDACISDSNSKSISDESKENYFTSVPVNSSKLVNRSYSLLRNQDTSTSRWNLIQSMPKKHKLSDQQTDLNARGFDSETVMVNVSDSVTEDNSVKLDEVMSNSRCVEFNNCKVNNVVIHNHCCKDHNCKMNM